MHLSVADRALLDGQDGAGRALAMRILVATAQLLGAEELLDIRSAHIDGCLYHGDSGVLFAEKLAGSGVRVSVPTTLNVGALDLVHAGRERLGAATRAMATRMTSAYLAMGCRPTWTCAPYQAGHRPARGEDVAWGESNAVVFCNSVLGARTNRYGDFLDICAAITGRAPRTGLHRPENRLATVLVDASALPRALLAHDLAFAVIGAWLGATVGQDIAAFTGLGRPSEDHLKALGAAAASSGAVGLFHIIGVTPEAHDLSSAFGARPPQRTIVLTPAMLREARERLCTVEAIEGQPIAAVAIGSPHLSAAELRALDAALGAQHCRVPLYACTSRHSLTEVAADGIEQTLKARGVVIIVDTCVVVTPLMPASGGVLVTNSGKFAFYAPPTTGYEVVFAPLEDCVASAVVGTLALPSGRFP